MSWIEGSLRRTVEIKAPYERVLEFFRDPNQFQKAFSQIDDAEEVEQSPPTWRWTLEEKNEKGIKYQAVYTVQYTPTPEGVAWKTLEGNMRSEGHAEIAPIDGGEGAKLTYDETLAADLPVPKLAAKIFRPIVAREVSKGIGDYLDRAKNLLEAT